MATLTVDGVAEDVVSRLVELAAEHGRSVEQEHRAILERAVADSVMRTAGPGVWAELARFRKEQPYEGGPTSTELLQESRMRRTERLCGKDD